MRALRILGSGVIAVAILLAASSVFAQDNPDFETGIKPYGSYGGGNIDTVNLSNGNLSLDIPLVSYPQEGGKLKLDFTYHIVVSGYFYTVGYIYDPDDTIVGNTTTETYLFNAAIIQQGALQFNGAAALNTAGTQWLASGEITMADGAVHQMAATSLSGPWRTVDASGFLGPSFSGGVFSGDVVDSDGITYTSGFNSIFSGEQDGNGNVISFNHFGSGFDGWTDTVGREIPFPDWAWSSDVSKCPTTPTSTSAWTWSPPGVGGGTYPITFCMGGSVPYLYYYWDTNGGSGTGWQAEDSGNGVVLQSIVLPNGTAWHFNYSTDGNQDVTQVTFPTGGALCYSWDDQTLGDASSQYFQVTHWVAERQLDTSGSCSGSSPTWTYTYAGGTGGATVSTVVDPAGNKTVHNFTFPSGTYSQYETETDYYQGTSSSMKTVDTTFTSVGSCNSNVGAVPTEVTTIWPNGQQSKIDFTYDSGFSGSFIWEAASPPPYGWQLGTTHTCVYGKEATKKEYDYYTTGTPSLIRTTSTSYQFVSDPTHYLAANMLNLPSEVTITGNGPGSDTTFGYDESGCSSHECGNQTSVHRYLNTTSSWLVTTNTYDSNGRLTSSSDPKSNTTQYGYSSSTCPSSGGGTYAGSGPTCVTNPLSQTTYYAYDFNTGLTTSVTDLNGVTRQSVYDTSHNMPRVVEIEYPNHEADTGATTFCYTDESTCAYSGPTPGASVVVTKALTSSVNKVSMVSVDGVGRESQTMLADPSGNDYGLTQYDGLGRKYRVYNPTRCSAITTNCGESTWGYTTYAYDALGRPTTVTKQDGSEVQTSYSGNSTSVTDEAGHQRRSYSDGAGRLIEVDEPGGSGGSPAGGTGSGNVSGSEQSAGGSSATAGAGSATTSGSEQSSGGSPASAGTGTLTIDGDEQSYWYDPCQVYYDEGDEPDWSYCEEENPGGDSIYDDGYVYITVNGTQSQYNYGTGDTPSTIATGLASAVNSNNSYVSASASGAVITLTARSTGASTDYSLSSTSTYDTWDFSSPSFWGTSSGSTLAGGSNGSSPVYDAGNAWITVNGVQCSTSYANGDTSSSVATHLASAVNSCSSVVNASASGTTVSLTAKTTGSSTNYSLSSGSSSSAGFSPSFSVSVSGGNLTGGSNGTAPTYDSGSAWITVNGFTASVSYGSSSTTSSVATALASALNAGGSPVSASSSGSGITLTSTEDGSGTNYSLSSGSSTSLPGTFSSPSFSVSVSGAALAGGTNGGNFTLSSPTVTTYTYDALDDLTAVSQGSSQSRSYTYDSLKRLLQSNNGPDAGTVCYGTVSGSTCQNNGYDADGNLIIKTDGRGIITCYGTWSGSSCDGSSGYNGINQLLKKSYSNGDPTVTYTYGGSSCLGGSSPCYNAGRRTALSDAGGSENFSYDPFGNVWVEYRTTNSHSNTTTYTYNFDSSTTSLTYPSGRTVTYTINAAGQAVSAVDTANSINYATSAVYGPTGALASINNGTNLASAFLFNSRLQPCRIAEMAGGGTMPSTCTDTNAGNILDLAYNFSLGSGDNGNVIEITNKQSGQSGRSQAFAYDTLNRIIMAGSAATSGSYCWGEVYSYDAWANLTNIAAQAGYSGCTQESGMSVSMTSGTNHISSFGYDAAGNTTSDGTYTYTWNAESEMSSAASTNYTYDGDGNRVEKSGAKLYWYGAGTEILDESTMSGTITEEYVFFGGKRIAVRDISSGNVYYYAGDFLGSTSKMVQDGQTSACFDVDYYPYGGERDYAASCNPVYRFEGKERDSETQNDDFGARYYSWRFGRWLSADWSAVPVPMPYAKLENPQTSNLYGMVADNPETDADLDGHDPNQAKDCNKETGSNGLACMSSDPNDEKNRANSQTAQKTQSDDVKARQAPLQVRVIDGRGTVDSGGEFTVQITSPNPLAPGKAVVSASLHFDDDKHKPSKGTAIVLKASASSSSANVGGQRTPNNVSTLNVDVRPVTPTGSFGGQSRDFNPGYIDFTVKDSQGNTNSGKLNLQIFNSQAPSPPAEDWSDKLSVDIPKP